MTTLDQQTWTLSNLRGLTATQGSYALVLNPAGAGIADLAGFASLASTSFVVDTTAPTVIAIDRLDPPLTNAASVRFQLSFSEPVASLTAANLTLDVASLTGVSITTVSGVARHGL